MQIRKKAKYWILYQYYFPEPQKNKEDKVSTFWFVQHLSRPTLQSLSRQKLTKNESKMLFACEKLKRYG